MADKVVVLGGGVGGLSAALHLASRGFDVEVFEASGVAGGKARSYPAAGTATPHSPGYPAEHGFRHIANFYRHLPDTLKRIPVGDGKMVADTLVVTEVSKLVQLKTPGVPVPQPAIDPLPVLDSFPTEFSELLTLVVDMTTDLGLWPGEAERFASCLWQVATSCRDRRQQELDQVAWADFIGAGENDDCSEAYSAYLEKGLSGALVAAQATQASACTIGEIVVWLMANTGHASTPDHVLPGPTSDTMIDPWLGASQAQGAVWHFDHEVVQFRMSQGKIAGVEVRDSKTGEQRRVVADYYVSALPPDKMGPLVTSHMAKADPSLGWLKNVMSKTDMAWMNGLQFYLDRDVPITPGFVLVAGSPWQVTAYSQPQFWDIDLTQYGNGKAKGLISAIVSNWDVEGLYVKKAARDCTEEEIFTEVFSQLMYSLNVDGKLLLTEDMVVHRTLDADLERTPAGSSGPRWHNTVPLWINVAGHLLLRPTPVTAIPNLFLAADYPQCNTNFASMEAADECGRRATNGILEASGSTSDPCELWSMSMPEALAPLRRKDQRLFDEGKPWNNEQEPPPDPYKLVSFAATPPTDESDAVQEDQLIQWWYWVAHLSTADGSRRFGAEIVFFSVDLLALNQTLDRLKFMRRANLWPKMSQVGITDIDNNTHVDQQILGWGEPASGTSGQRFNLTTHNNDIEASGGGGSDRISGRVNGYQVDLEVTQEAPPTVHYAGRKCDYHLGGYTYYYSRDDMRAVGTVRTPDGAVYDVSGPAWFDRQYGELVQAVLVGWQWFAIQLDDGRRIMLFAFNKHPGDWYGTIVGPGMPQQELGPGDFEIEIEQWWRSPRTLIRYPAKWKVRVAGEVLRIRPLVADQEMAKRLLWFGPRYWEGACEVKGSATGQAYVELNGFSRFGTRGY